MTLHPQKFREMVFQMLYSKDIGHPLNEDLLPLMMQELAVTKRLAKDALKRAEEIFAQSADLDARIAQTSHAYAFERIPGVERNILRLGLFEMLMDDEIPPRVAIAEAMRLARKFSSIEAARFINAILDALYKQSIGEDISQDLEVIADTQNALDKSEEENLEKRRLREEEEGEG